NRLKQLRGVGSTGSPLSREGVRWVYGVKRDVWVASISGGTDLCRSFVGGCATIPGYSGEIQCRGAGADVRSVVAGGPPGGGGAALPEDAESLAVDLEGLEGRSYLPLFVVLSRGARLDEALKKKIRQKISEEISPRCVPDEIFAVPEIPRTLSGKKLEVPIK